jgi:AraC-like DNA-binding protein
MKPADQPPERTFLSETCTRLTDVRVMRSERGDSIVRRNCPDGQFWLISKGAWHFQEEGASRTLGAFDIAYSAPAEPCVRTTEDHLVAFGVQVRRQALARWPECRRWLAPGQAIPPEFKRSYFQLFQKVLCARVNGDDLEDQIVLMLGRGRNSPVGDRRCRWLDEARQILHDEDPGRQSLAAIAEAVGVSPAYLSTSFRRQFGVHLAAYRRTVRLKNAFGIASKRRIPLNEAAVEAGFYDASHFHRACVTEFGMEPRAVMSLANP